MSAFLDPASKRRALLALVPLTLLVACSSSSDPDAGPELVLLISVDTLRADRLGAYGSDRGLTPRLDELANESVVFERAYAPSSFTVPSVSAFLTGRYPEQNGIYTNEFTLNPKVPTLATLLKDEGYRTGAVVSNWVLRRASGLDAGFEDFNDRFGQIEINRGAPERIAAYTTDDTLAMLDRLTDAGQRVFLWVHYQDPHGPYTPPEDYLATYVAKEKARPGGRAVLPLGRDHRGLDGIPTYQVLGSEREVGHYIGAYDAEVRYMDEELGRLMDGVKQRGLWNSATVAFVADHGEGLGEKGYWFAHGEYLNDPLVHVPMILRSPNLKPGRHGAPVGLVDLLPSMAGLLPFDAPSGILGNDVLSAPPDASHPLYLATLLGATRNRLAFIQDGYRLVAEFDEAGTMQKGELYRIGEDEEISAQDPTRAQALLQALIQYKSEKVKLEHPATPQPRTQMDLEALRALGYVE